MNQTAKYPILRYDNFSELDKLRDDWDRLGASQPKFFPNFSQMRDHLVSSESKFLVFVAKDSSDRVAALACFVNRNAIKRYSIGDRKLFDLSVREIFLFGSCVLGDADESLIEQFFRLLISNSSFDLINLGEIVIRFSVVQSSHQPS